MLIVVKLRCFFDAVRSFNFIYSDEEFKDSNKESCDSLLTRNSIDYCMSPMTLRKNSRTPSKCHFDSILRSQQLSGQFKAEI